MAQCVRFPGLTTAQSSDDPHEESGGCCTVVLHSPSMREAPGLIPITREESQSKTPIAGTGEMAPEDQASIPSNLQSAQSVTTVPRDLCPLLASGSEEALRRCLEMCGRKVI